MTILALTSIPSRFPKLTKRLEMLLRLGASKLVLTLPHRYQRFPDWDGRMPAIPAGVTLLRSDDFGPATKFVAAFSAFPSDDVLLVDDDCSYDRGWYSHMMAARAQHPNAVIASSCFSTSRLGLSRDGRVVQGFGGVMVRPDMLGADVLDVTRPAVWVDDIWLSAHIAAGGLDVVECEGARAHIIAQDGDAALQDALIDGMDRGALNRMVAHELSARLGIWR